jgi:hypothetical protein
VRRHWKAIAINLVAVAIALLGFEIWRHHQTPLGADARYEGTIMSERYYDEVDDLGYLPRPGRRVTARKLVGSEVIYDVAYTIGPDGFRVRNLQDRCVVLFGDSNTFGEGVNDTETYAWRLGAYNFGMSGYGAHQMLAGLQSGRYAKSLACTPTHAVYFFLPEHVARTAGRAPWDPHGPRFRLVGGPGSEKQVVREGNFDGFPKPPPPDLDEGTIGWRRWIGINATGTPEEAELTAAVILEARREVAKLAPTAKFEVLFWATYRNDRLDTIAARLAAAGIAMHRPEQVIPDFGPADMLSNYDRHPNPAAHGKIAGYIAREIVSKAR